MKAIGQRPRTEFLRLIDGVELDHGMVKVDPVTGADRQSAVLRSRRRHERRRHSGRGGSRREASPRSGVHEWLERGWA